MKIHATTILTVRRGSSVALGGDGQVTLDTAILKGDSVKIRSLMDGKDSTDGCIALRTSMADNR